MNDLRTWFFILIALTGGCFFTLSAQHAFIRHFTTSEGLPSNNVCYIYQDSKKFLWFATDAGVVKYDGMTFRNFRKKDGLTSNDIIRIKEDSFGRIWFMNYNGSVDYYYNNQIFNSTSMPFLQSVRGTIFFHDFIQDSDLTIYFYNYVNEILAINPKNEVTKFRIKNNDIWPSHILRHISKAPDGSLVLWGNTCIARLNSFSDKPSFIAHIDSVVTVFPTRDKSFIVNCISRGLIRFTADYQRELLKLPFKAPYSFIKIRSVMEDVTGFLWIVTWDEGVYCVKDGKVIHHFTIPEGQAVLQDHENNIWITSMSDGVYMINSNLLAGKQYYTSLFDNRGITAMAQDLKEGVWFLNGEKIYLLKDNKIYTVNSKIGGNSLNLIGCLKNALIVGEKGFLFSVLKNLRPDPATQTVVFRQMIVPPEKFGSKKYALKNISINSTGERISSFGGGYDFFIFSADNLFSNYQEVNLEKNIYNTFFNINDDLVINSSINYIYRNDSLMPSEEWSFLNNKKITDYMILPENVELFNVDGDSLFLKQGDKFYNLTAYLQSPIDLQVKNIAYHHPDLYISNFNHIYKISNPLQILQKKQVFLQLIDIDFNKIQDILVYRDSLYVATEEGLIIIPEAGISKIATHTPIPYIESVMVNDEGIDKDDPDIKIKGSAKIKFNLSCINYSSSPVVYSYMLKGLDTIWTTGTATSIIYQNLPRGDYIFKMRVRKVNATWSKPVEYPVTVTATLWKHPLFLFALILIFVMIFILLILLRKNFQNRRREIDHQLVTLEQKALQSMMNPHFIFNSLGSIQNYLLQKNTSAAGLYLSQFARLIRQNLNAIKDTMINLEEETDRLRNYLDLEKMRLSGKFEYSITLDESIEADQVLIPSMLVQPLAENAIWHGITPLEYKGIISIRFQQETAMSLRIIVEDNGIGMKKSGMYSTKNPEHLQMTLVLNRKRLELLGKKFKIPTRIDFYEAFTGAENPGTRVEMVIPFI